MRGYSRIYVTGTRPVREVAVPEILRQYRRWAEKHYAEKQSDYGYTGHLFGMYETWDDVPAEKQQ